MREAIRTLLEQVGKDYELRGVAKLDLLHEEHDVHAFYRIGGEKVVHVQAYTGVSSLTEVMIRARIMDQVRLFEARREGVPVGNEHMAVISEFQNFGLGIMIPYNPEILEDKLAESVPELR